MPAPKNNTVIFSITRCLCFLLAALAVQCSSGYRTETERGETVYIGRVDRALFEKPEFPWFKSGYTAYSPNSGLLDSVRQSKDSLYAIVFLGTWCPDTQRELPRFLKILDTEKLPLRVLEYHAVDRNKKSGEMLPTAFAIRFVPTFVFMRNGREVGRIVEAPNTTFETDLARMFSASR